MCYADTMQPKTLIVISDILQSSAATLLRCGRLFSNHFTKTYHLLVKEFLKSANIWQTYKWLTGLHVMFA